MKSIIVVCFFVFCATCTIPTPTNAAEPQVNDLVKRLLNGDIDTKDSVCKLEYVLFKKQLTDAEKNGVCIPLSKNFKQYFCSLISLITGEPCQDVVNDFFLRHVFPYLTELTPKQACDALSPCKK